MPNLEENGEWYINFLSFIVVFILDFICLFFLRIRGIYRIELMSFYRFEPKQVKEGGRGILGAAEKKTASSKAPAFYN